VADPGQLNYPADMADGFTLRIDEPLAQDLERRAKAAGLTREELALQLLQQDVINYDDYDWDGEDPETAIAEADSSDEPSRPLSEAKPELIAHLQSLLRNKS
jgi:hypothetical protein